MKERVEVKKPRHSVKNREWPQSGGSGGYFPGRGSSKAAKGERLRFLEPRASCGKWEMQVGAFRVRQLEHKAEAQQSIWSWPLLLSFLSPEGNLMFSGRIMAVKKVFEKEKVTQEVNFGFTG